MPRLLTRADMVGTTLHLPGFLARIITTKSSGSTHGPIPAGKSILEQPLLVLTLRTRRCQAGRLRALARPVQQSNSGARGTGGVLRVWRTDFIRDPIRLASAFLDRNNGDGSHANAGVMLSLLGREWRR